MEPKDLIPGKIYYNSFDGGWIVRILSIRGDQIEHKGCMQAHRFSWVKGEGSWGGWNLMDNNLREATADEIRHLEACEKAGKYVPMPEIEPIYSIFN